MAYCSKLFISKFKEARKKDEDDTGEMNAMPWPCLFLPIPRKNKKWDEKGA